jgi:hypothetical protein
VLANNAGRNQGSEKEANFDNRHLMPSVVESCGFERMGSGGARREKIFLAHISGVATLFYEEKCGSTIIEYGSTILGL